jgi:hypothetical protein
MHELQRMFDRSEKNISARKPAEFVGVKESEIGQADETVERVEAADVGRNCVTNSMSRIEPFPDFTSPHLRPCRSSSASIFSFIPRIVARTSATGEPKINGSTRLRNSRPTGMSPAMTRAFRSACFSQSMPCCFR